MVGSSRRLGFVLVAALGILLTASAVASAKTYVVTRTGDPSPGKCKPNDCSVREAVRAANKHAGGDVVVLPKRHPRYTLSRPNTTTFDEEQGKTGDLDVTGALTIRHGGQGVATIDANHIDRVLDVQAGAPTKLVRIKATGGNQVLPDPPPKRAKRQRRALVLGDGGGIWADAALKLVRSAVIGNGGADVGGGIESTGRLTLVRTKVSGNKTVNGVSGGIDANDGRVRIVHSKITSNHAGNAGGGIATDGVDLSIGKSTVANNIADAGSTGIYLYQSTARITQSTISGNVARNGSDGGGVDVEQLSKLAMVNSTVTRNRADTDGGGIEDGGGSQVSLNSVTVARNTADADGNASGIGGGLFAAKATSFSVVNSIVALNHAGASSSDCFGTYSSGGGNLIGSLAACGGFGGSDLIGPNPKLGQLANNGGPTKTLALRKGSPAIGNAVKSKAPRRDQRGHKRDKHPDSGAFER